MKPKQRSVRNLDDKLYEKYYKATKKFKKCGKGGNVCKCKKACECGYLA